MAYSIAPLPTPSSISSLEGATFTLAQAVNSVLYFAYSSAVAGPELYAYTPGSGVVQLTDVEGASGGLNPTEVLSFNGSLLFAGTSYGYGAELYRIAGTGLSLTDAQAESAAVLSPNPTTSQLTITLPSTSRYTLRILSTTGQILRTQTIEGASPSISIADLTPGLYFAQITDATTGAPVGTARFVKE